MKIGNNSKLVKSEYCQKCARCCKEFVVHVSPDEAQRQKWLNMKEVIVYDKIQRFQDSPGKEFRKIVYKFPCSNLEFRDEKYYCKVYNELRPDFCCDYPDQYFFNITPGDMSAISGTLKFIQEDCPGTKQLNVDDVIRILDLK